MLTLVFHGFYLVSRILSSQENFIQWGYFYSVKRILSIDITESSGITAKQVQLEPTFKATSLYWKSVALLLQNLVLVFWNFLLWMGSQSSLFCYIFLITPTKLDFGLVVKALDYQSRGPMLKTTGWLQGRLSLSSFRGLSGDLVVKSKLPPRSGSSLLEAVEHHP